jgi:hypothetical protein
MAKEKDIKPFTKLPLIKYFQHDLEKIKMAYRLSDSIRQDLTNIRAAGDQVELAVKNFFSSKLYPKYHVCDGHIADVFLKVSPQLDIIITENSKNPVLFNLADKSEIVYYETVYCFGEVKRSNYNKKILSQFSTTIKRLKNELVRTAISPNYIECANSAGFETTEPLTTLPLRNPILSFLFFINGSTTSFSDLGTFLKKTSLKHLPNYIVLLDIGIIVNIDKKSFDERRIKINLYPEYETEENLWVMLELGDENNVLTYQYMLLLEHLNNSVVSIPNIKEYTKNLFNFSFSNVHTL